MFYTGCTVEQDIDYFGNDIPGHSGMIRPRITSAGPKGIDERPSGRDATAWRRISLRSPRARWMVDVAGWPGFLTCRMSNATYLHRSEGRDDNVVA